MKDLYIGVEVFGENINSTHKKGDITYSEFILTEYKI